MLPYTQPARLQGPRRPGRLPAAALLFAAALILGSMACGNSTGPEMDQLTLQRSIWMAAGLTDYTYDVRRVCFCPFREDGVRLTVLTGVLAGGIDIATGEALAADEVQWYHTIDGLFDLLEDAYKRDAHSVQVDFDTSRGHPTMIFIDYSEMIADEELGFTLLSDVQAL